MIRTALTPPVRRSAAKLILDELRTELTKTRVRESLQVAIDQRDITDLQHATLQLLGMLGGDEIEAEAAELLGWKSAEKPYIPAGEKQLQLIEAQLKHQALTDAARPMYGRPCNDNGPAPAVRPPVPPGPVRRAVPVPHHQPAGDDHKRAAAGDRDD